MTVNHRLVVVRGRWTVNQPTDPAANRIYYRDRRADGGNPRWPVCLAADDTMRRWMPVKRTPMTLAGLTVLVLLVAACGGAEPTEEQLAAEPQLLYFYADW